jgi:hypothetical protein
MEDDFLMPVYILVVGGIPVQYQLAGEVGWDIDGGFDPIDSIVRIRDYIY